VAGYARLIMPTGAQASKRRLARRRQNSFCWARKGPREIPSTSRRHIPRVTVSQRGSVTCTPRQPSKVRQEFPTHHDEFLATLVE